MKNRWMLFMVAVSFALGVTSASKADDIQKCSIKGPRLTVTFVDGDAESPVGGNDARGQFGIIFTATADGGRRFIPRGMNREEDFFIMKNQVPVNPYRFLIAVSSPVFEVTPFSPCDTPWDFCVPDGSTRTFTLSMELSYPEESGFFGVRLRRLNVAGKVKYSGGIRQFVTPSVHINNVDVTN